MKFIAQCPRVLFEEDLACRRDEDIAPFGRYSRCYYISFSSSTNDRREPRAQTTPRGDTRRPTSGSQSSEGEDCDVSRGVFQGPGTSSFSLSRRHERERPTKGRKEEVVEGWYISFKSWFLTVSLQDLIMRCTIETKVSSPQRLFLNLIFSRARRNSGRGPTSGTRRSCTWKQLSTTNYPIGGTPEGRANDFSVGFQPMGCSRELDERTLANP